MYSVLIIIFVIVFCLMTRPVVILVFYSLMNCHHMCSPGSVLVLSAKPLLTKHMCNKCNKKIVVYYNYHNAYM